MNISMSIPGSSSNRLFSDDRILRSVSKAPGVSSHDDHRMAMSLAVAALRSDEAVEIEGAEGVAKSYPGFFGDLEHIRV